MRDITFGGMHSTRKITMQTPDLVMVKLLNPEQPNRKTTVLAVVGDMATCWT